MNIRARRSRAALRAALLSCMDEKPLREITVTEVCERAGLTRCTFYKHYQDFGAIIDELQEEQLEKLRVMLDAREESGEALLRDILESLDQALRLFRVESGGALPDGFKDGLVETAKEHGLQAWKERLSSFDEDEAEMIYEAFLAGSLRVALSAGADADREKVVRTIMDMLESLIEHASRHGDAQPLPTGEPSGVSPVHEKVFEEHRELAENSARFFALEDAFMSLYDVNLESGHYVSFDRDEFYQRNVSDKVASQTEFFKDLRTNVERVVYEEDREGVYRIQTREAIVHALADKDHIDHYYRIITEDGPMWLKMRIVYKDASKENVILGIFNAEEEVEARQREEQFKEELIQTNARLFALEDNFESVYDVEMESGRYDVFVKGDFFRNNVLEKLSVPNDYFAELRANIDAVIFPEDRDGLYRALTRDSIRAELAEADHFDYYYRIGTDEGPIWLKMRVVYKDADKKNIIIGVFNAENDVEAKQLVERQEQLQEALQAAEAANRSKSDFLFSMSHDIRTPMNAITGFTSMAEKHIDDKEKVLDCLQKIQQAGGILLALINGALEVSRIESGNAVLEEQCGDVHFSFANIEGTMRELAAAKDIDLTFGFGDVRDCYVYADFGRCMRVFVNVISNAVKYTPEGGRVRVFCEQVGEAADGIVTYRYTVEDNGIGMSEEFQEHVFEQFSRENTSTVSGIQGTGLGLAVCKSFVDLMGGTIECKSKQGVGTTFAITLPFKLQEGRNFIDPVTGEVVTDEAAEEAVEYVELAGRRVLLVEDNELNREIALDLLEEEGLVVEEAEDGLAAVELLWQKGPDYYDFILMDIQMPIVDGYEATREIRAMYPEATLPIIAVSANAFAEDKVRSREAGMDDHVAKPINVGELLAALAKHLR